MDRIRIGPAHPDMAPFVAAALRPADRRECEALVGGPDVEPSIRESIERSQWAFAAIEARGILAVWGVAPVTVIGRSSAPWALFTVLAADHRFAIARESRRWVALMRREFPEMVNAVDGRNRAAMRWLGWLGFELADAVPLGPARVPFHPFRMTTHV